MTLTDEEIFKRVAANQYNQVASEIETDIWTDISRPISFGMMFNIIGAPICLAALGPVGIVPIVFGNLYLTGMIASKVNEYTPNLSYHRITEAILDQYETKLGFPSRSVLSALVAGDFEEVKTLMADFKMPSEEVELEEKLLRDVEVVKELPMYG